MTNGTNHGLCRIGSRRTAFGANDQQPRGFDEAERTATKRDRVRADDARCADLAASNQADYAAHGVTPPLPNADEWSAGYEKRLLLGLQRRLSPDSKLAD